MNSMADALSLHLVFGPSIIIYTPLTLLKLLAKGHWAEPRAPVVSRYFLPKA